MTAKARAPGQRPAVLCVLDGWGHRPEAADNAIAAARTPNFDRLLAECPHALLATSGGAVGLPAGQMGNSEVGHTNIGAGRVVLQDLPRIDEAVATGALERNPALVALMDKCKAAGGAVHLLGLVSSGGVHSHQDHFVALSRILARAGLAVRIHCFLDGRDTPPKSAPGFVRSLLDQIEGGSGTALATVSGRYYAMDRDKRWDRVAKAYAAIVSAEGSRFPDPFAAITESYRAGVTDEFVLPCVIGDYAGMHDGDAVLFVNFRADRMRELAAALLDPAFAGFTRGRAVAFSASLSMTEYSDHLRQFLPALFPPENLHGMLGEVIAGHGLSQLRIAETEKYAHVTFFLNGGREERYPGEDRILVPSPKVATYDLKPEMSAPEVTHRLVEAIEAGRYDFIVVNYANPDMVGHTGDMKAAVAAVETVDACLGRLRAAVEKAGGVMLVTADHGNVELMRDPETGEPHTAHTTLDVPLIAVNARAFGGKFALAPGRLADVAPTLLDLMGLPRPAEMSGRSLVRPAVAGHTGVEAHA